MKKINSIKSTIITLMIVITVSCNKENHIPISIPNDNRNIKYEITGNANGTFDTTYITGSGKGINESPTSLPWSKEIMAQVGVDKLSFNAIVIGAKPGKTITAKIFVGGLLKKEITATVQSNGMAIISGLYYVLR